MEYEVRKVQRLGYSSVGISLPKDWAKEVGISPGSAVSLLREGDGTLKLSVGVHVKAPEVPCEIEVDDKSEGETLLRQVTGAYIAGRGTVRVKSKAELTPAQLREVHEAVRGLSGLTIVAQGPRFVQIENFAEPARFPVDGLLRRLHYLTTRMGRLAFGSLDRSMAVTPEETIKLEEEVDRIYWLLSRQLLLAAKNRTAAESIGMTKPNEIVASRLVAMALEHIGDMWVETAEAALALAPRAARDFPERLRTVRTDLERQAEAAMIAFFGGNVKLANEALDLEPVIVAAVRALAAELPSGGPPKSLQGCSSCLARRAVLRPLVQIAKYYAAIAHLTINKSLE